MLLLNADLGESWYDRIIGQDAALMPHLDLCNLACGFHGGDVGTQRATLELAAHHGVKAGAHPSFPDRKHFGRVIREITDTRLLDLLLYQVAGLQALANRSNQSLYHLKPHGALYHYADRRPGAAAAVAGAARQLGIDRLIGPPDGELSRAAAEAGLTFLAEGFADRAYEPDLRLRDRSLPDAVLKTEEEIQRRVADLRVGRVIATDGSAYPLHVATVCLHGDHQGAGERAAAIRQLL